jgi:Fe2+ transport system protein B
MGIIQISSHQIDKKMKGTDKINLRQDLACITVVLEHWIPVLEQMEKIQANLGDLPGSLKVLRQQLNELDRNSNLSSKNSWNKVSNAEKINRDRLRHLEIQTLINNLEKEIPRLVFLEEKITNLIALKEIIEALQERVKNQITSSYDAEFQELKYHLEQARLQEENLRYSGVRRQNLPEVRQANKSNPTKGIRNHFKKIDSNSISENLGIGLTILFVFFLSWTIFNTVTSPNKINPEVDATVIDAGTRWERLEE